MDHRTFLSTLNPDRKARLTERSDRAGLIHLAGHLALILGTGALIAAQVPFWGVLLLPQGVFLAFLFTLQHEATHKTPFRTEALNEAVGFVAGLLIFQPFHWFRYFHLAHHRHTNDPDNDPELAGLPKPDDWPALIRHLSCVDYLRDKAVHLATLASGRIGADYIPPRALARVRAEARAMLAIYLCAVLTLLIGPVLIWTWLVPLLFGFPVLRLYLLAEHGRCPKVADMFLNTRTTFTNRAVRFLAWNMPYHAEHHVYPQVPFHRLAEFHDDIRSHLGTTSPGYVAFTRGYVGGMATEKS